MATCGIGVIVTVTVLPPSGVLGLFAVSTAVNMNVTVAPVEAPSVSVSVATHGPPPFGSTVSRGSEILNGTTAHDATPVGSLSVAGNVTVAVLLTFRSMVALVSDVAGPISARFTN